MHVQTLGRLLVLGLLCLGCTRPSVGQQTDNHELRVVPAHQPVTIDGMLDDWELSGEILLCHDVGTLLETKSARAAAMHADRGFYLSLRVKDPTPMQNPWDPVAQPFQGWRADNAQIYFWDDPGAPFGPEGSRVMQLTCWWCHESSRPGASIMVGPIGHGREPEAKLTDMVGKGVDLAYRRDDDGRGYTAEMRIDWRLLSRHGRAYRAGTSMGMGLEVFWGNPSGDGPEHRLTDLLNPERPQRSFYWSTPEAWGTARFVAENNVPPSDSIKLLDIAERLRRQLYSTSGPVPIRYGIPAAGGVTLVIEDEQGRRVRNLISDYPREAGVNMDYWDGRDDEGRVAAPGTYRVRGLCHRGLDVTYEFAFGTPGNPPWPSADGRGGWLSNHTNHMAVLADEDRLYVAAPETEGPYPLIALDYDGNRVWGGLSRWYAGFMARAGDYLYVVNDRHALPARQPEDLDQDAEIELIRIDPETGREAVFPDGKSKHTIATWNIQEQGTAKKWEGWTIENQAHDADWIGINPQGIAALNGALYVSLHYQDKLLKIDAESGTVTGDIRLERPAGLTSDGDRMLAISETHVVEVNPGTGDTVPLITDGLAAPIGLAVDAPGNVYVSDWADQMCVKVFSKAGEYLRTIGLPGGRPWVGAYDRRGMLLPMGITADARGRLWVAESDFSPRRVSCWDAATGELVLERLGRGRYGGMGYYVLPDEPTRGVVMNNLVELDWEGGQWRVLSTLWRGTHADEPLGFDPYTRFGRVIDYQGRRLLVHSSRRPQSGPVILSELKEGRAVPLAAAGFCGQALMHVPQQHRGGFEPNPIFADHLWTDARMHQAALQIIPWFFAGPRAGDRNAPSAHYQRMDIWRKSGIAGGYPKTHGAPNANFLWSDQNANGRMDADEVRYFATPGLPGPLPAPWHAESWSGGVVADDLSFRLTAVQDGKAYHFRLPVSRWTANGVPVYDPDRAERIAASTYMGEAAWLSSEGHLLTLGNIPATGRPDRQRDPLVMFRPDGTVAWTFPSPWTGVHGSHTAPKEKRGQLVGPLGVCGQARFEQAGEILAFHTNVGTADFLTSDGLYVGRIFRDGRSAADPWPARPRRGGSLNQMTNGGEWFGGQFFQRPDTGNCYVVCSRHAGVVAKVTGLDTVRRLPQQEVEFTQAQYNEAVAQLPDADEQKRKRVMQVQRLAASPAQLPPPRDSFTWDANRSATWRYDETRSAQATWSYDDTHLHLAFRVQDDTPMVNGGEDVRRLFKFGDAVLLELRTQPANAGRNLSEGDVRLLFSVYQGEPVAVLYDYRHPGSTDPVEFRSVTTTRIDRLVVLGDAQMAIDRTADGYTLRASVTLSELGFHPEPGKTYPGDFGAVYSDKSGTANCLRMHWANQATGIVSDLSLEAAIQPQQWGRFEVAP
jgi:hypothetical protein